MAVWIAKNESITENERKQKFSHSGSAPEKCDNFRHGVLVCFIHSVATSRLPNEKSSVSFPWKINVQFTFIIPWLNIWWFSINKILNVVLKHECIFRISNLLLCPSTPTESFLKCSLQSWKLLDFPENIVKEKKRIRTNYRSKEARCLCWSISPPAV